MYAWAGSNLERSSHWKALPLLKVKRALIGTDFLGSEPLVLREFHRRGRLRIPRVAEGTFHPKLILGIRGTQGLAIIGSSNFTAGGFGANTELNVFFCGPISSRSFRDLFALVDAQWDTAGQVTNEWLTAYTERFVRRPRPLQPPPLEPSARTQSTLLDVPWSGYVQRLRSVDDIETDAEVLRRSMGLLASTRFQDLADDKMRNVAGWNDDDDGDSGTFGSMRAAGLFKSICRRQPKRLGEHLDRIPATGEIDKRAVRAYLAGLLQIRGVGISGATRLLVSKRPDQFLCLNRGNLERLRTETKIRLTLQGARTVDHYMALLEYLYECPWYRSPRPRGEELKFWRGRVAFVDRLVWRGHA